MRKKITALTLAISMLIGGALPASAETFPNTQNPDVTNNTNVENIYFDSYFIVKSLNGESNVKDAMDDLNDLLAGDELYFCINGLEQDSNGGLNVDKDWVIKVSANEYIENIEFFYSNTASDVSQHLNNDIPYVKVTLSDDLWNYDEESIRFWFYIYDTEDTTSSGKVSVKLEKPDDSNINNTNVENIYFEKVLVLSEDGENTGTYNPDEFIENIAEGYSLWFPIMDMEANESEGLTVDKNWMVKINSSEYIDNCEFRYDQNNELGLGKTSYVVVFLKDDFSQCQSNELSFWFYIYDTEDKTSSSRLVFKHQFENNSPVLLGDLNGDSDINSADVNIFYRNVMGYTDLTEAQLSNADINKDGDANSADVNLLYRFVMGYIESL